MPLPWLPVRDDWDEQLRHARFAAQDEAIGLLRSLALSQMEFPQLGKLDRALTKVLAAGQAAALEPVRLAILGSSTTNHLPAAIRVAGLRRGLAIEIYEAPYGMYRQELLSADSGLARFRPDVVLLALDARHMVACDGASPEAAIELMQDCWLRARASFGCQVIQQTLLPVLPAVLGDNEERLACSPATRLEAVNQKLREVAASEGVDLLAIDRLCAVDGLREWHDAALWHRAKYEVHPRAAELYGDHVARLVAAERGRSAKCLVLDLDNTLWGGVIGDDGLEGILLGQGSAAGEAHVELQRYVKKLAMRGVVLAVCSKNDEANAREPFEEHLEMVLRSGDIACFVANWEDKAANLREIAARLNLGLDALVFLDDNPVERALIRRELPMVMVPEIGEDPAEYVGTLAAAGYFEGLRVTEEDRERAAMYQANAERERLKRGYASTGSGATDLDSYLDSLDMTLTAGPIDGMCLARATQLINKTNQFNLTTKRMTECEVAAAVRNPHMVTLQVRLADRFGDNGMIAVLLACTEGPEAQIQLWLMSCRVLGRRVEEACLNLLVEQLRGMGVERVYGLYKPTAKNAMVSELYERLGFSRLQTAATGEPASDESHWELEIARFTPHDVPMRVISTASIEAQPAVPA
ncbi:HAD-superfamily phosphatase, subfamily IIIC/FkbH-like domain-containing protein [Bryocella elongata]|uniref:HAD-superfamily phosphatase, subfamily IIIC/FkbH-like domain-containing protein n=1 Tax=Bryocella elongata TaxID=863522 RepID=A0A1H5XT89_9BACT|nr:HAD-IIIC family phosphatase [Bryocella elongata]SEG14888.1 HAD-superfamily phosphatase, subfamily IIIC/FkbH-like domain-containing protein [Bryocella elongata]